MFGHGRGQNVAALVSAFILICFMSLETFWEPIPKFFKAPEVGDFRNVTLASVVIMVGMAVMAVPAISILRTKAKGTSVKAQLIALLKDALSYIVALIAVFLVGQGYYLGDLAVSTLVATIIALSCVCLFKDNVHYLVGRAFDKQFMGKSRVDCKVRERHIGRV